MIDDADNEFSDPQSWERLRTLMKRRNPDVDAELAPVSIEFLYLMDTLNRLVNDNRKAASFFDQLKRSIKWH